MNEASRVAEWIQKTGFPLEMKVASAFKKSDCINVTQGLPYVDIESDKVRECDVFATWQAAIEGCCVAFHFAIECKSQTGLPWVAFSSKDTLPESSTSVHFRVAHNLCGAERKEFDFDIQNFIMQAAVEGEGSLIHESRSNVYAISQALREKKNQRDLAYDATRQALASAVGICAGSANTSPENSAPFVSYFFPVVVTEDSLYTCTSEPEREAEVSQVDYLTVPMKLEGTDDQHHVRVLNPSALDAFVTKCSLASKYLLDASAR